MDLRRNSRNIEDSILLSIKGQGAFKKQEMWEPEIEEILLTRRRIY
jgi:hypothetical protein